MKLRLLVNGSEVGIDTDPEKPLLWVLREDLALLGTRYGCGVAACGACTVHLDGRPARSCSVPVGDVGARAVTTIEGVAAGPAGARVEAAWVAHQVPQCGYCQSGMVMATTALLAESPQPTDAEVDAAITNLCRCGTYPRIRAAIRALARQERPT